MRLPLQQRHVQVAAGAILALRDVLAPRAYEHECESPIGGVPTMRVRSWILRFRGYVAESGVRNGIPYTTLRYVISVSSVIVKLVRNQNRLDAACASTRPLQEGLMQLGQAFDHRFGLCALESVR